MLWNLVGEEIPWHCWPCPKSVFPLELRTMTGVLFERGGSKDNHPSGGGAFCLVSFLRLFQGETTWYWACLVLRNCECFESRKQNLGRDGHRTPDAPRESSFPNWQKAAHFKWAKQVMWKNSGHNFASSSSLKAAVSIASPNQS